jgi:hypothetical protein
MVLITVSILLILSIFGMIVRAWSDPVKSINAAVIQLTTVKMDENKASMLKKAEPAKGSPEWLKTSQGRPRDVNSFLRTPEEKKRSLWVESLDKMMDSRELSEIVWKNKLSNSLYAKSTKSSSSASGQSTIKTHPDENSSFEQAKTFTKLKLLQSREEAYKEIFMGVSFSLDLTNGHMLFEMNVTPSADKKSGLLIRF